MSGHTYSNIPLQLLPDSTFDLEEPVSAALTVRSDVKDPDHSSVSFRRRAVIETPRLDEYISKSDGRLSHLAIDIAAIDTSTSSDRDDIEVIFRDLVVERRTFQKWYRKSQMFVPLSRLYDSNNLITIRASWARRHDLRFYICNKTDILDDLERKSIWIFSAPRSGSTWLTEMIGWQKQARPVDESGLGRMVSPMQMQPGRFCDLSSWTVPFESGVEYETGRRPRSHQGLPPFQRHFAEVARSEQNEQLLAPEHRHMFGRHIRSLALEHVLAIWGFLDYDRVVFKCPVDSQGADLLMEAFPQACLIFLVRDGRDVLRSLFSPFISGENLAEANAVRRRYFITFYAHLWNFWIDIAQSAYDNHKANLRSLIKYEDLRKSPKTVLRQLFKNLNIRISRGEVDSLVKQHTLENLPQNERGPDKPRQSGEVGGFVSYFSQDEIDLMNSIMAPNLRRHGYEVEPPSSSPSLLSYEIGAAPENFQAGRVLLPEDVERLRATLTEQAEKIETYEKIGLSLQQILDARETQLQDLNRDFDERETVLERLKYHFGEISKWIRAPVLGYARQIGESSGIFHDGWVTKDVRLQLRAERAISNIIIRGFIPEHFPQFQRNFEAQIHGRAFQFPIADHGAFYFDCAIDIPKDTEFEVILRCNSAYNAHEAGTGGDRRDLSYRLNAIELRHPFEGAIDGVEFDDVQPQ